MTTGVLSRKSIRREEVETLRRVFLCILVFHPRNLDCKQNGSWAQLLNPIEGLVVSLWSCKTLLKDIGG